MGIAQSATGYDPPQREMILKYPKIIKSIPSFKDTGN